MDQFFAAEFCIYFSENPPNVTSNVIFSTQKTLQKVMKITRFELLRGPFIYRDQASRREPKIMQNDAKMHHKSPRNEHEKIQIPVVQCSKTHAVDRPAKLHENAFAFVVPVLLCVRHGCKNRSKSLKFYHEITTKSTNAGVAMVSNARCLSTCEHASKRVDVCRYRCCFAHAMDAKFVQIIENHRW